MHGSLTSGKEVGGMLKKLVAGLGRDYEAPMMIDVESIVAGCVICITSGGGSN